MTDSFAFFRSAQYNDFDSSTKDRYLKIDISVAQYDNQDGYPKNVSSASIFWAYVTELDSFQRYFYKVDLNRKHGDALIVIKAEVDHTDGSLL